MITIPIKIDEDSIASLIVSMTDTDSSGYWCEIDNEAQRVPTTKKRDIDCDCPKENKFHWVHCDILHHGSFNVTDHETGKAYVVTMAKIKKALALMSEKCTWAFSEILTGEADNDTADSLLQFVCFGELIYG